MFFYLTEIKRWTGQTPPEKDWGTGNWHLFRRERGCGCCHITVLLVLWSSSTLNTFCLHWNWSSNFCFTHLSFPFLLVECITLLCECCGAANILVKILWGNITVWLRFPIAFYFIVWQSESCIAPVFPFPARNLAR